MREPNQTPVADEPDELVPGPLIGYRVYRFGQGRLLPLFHRVSATSDELPLAREAGYVPAHCADGFCEHRGSGSVPCALGACGWYSFRDWRRALRMFLDSVFSGDPVAQTTDYVLAEVAIWGRVAIAEHGYRSQFCYPTRLWALRARWAQQDRRQRQLAGAAQDYGVSLEWVPFSAELLARFHLSYTFLTLTERAEYMAQINARITGSGRKTRPGPGVAPLRWPGHWSDFQTCLYPAPPGRRDRPQRAYPVATPRWRIAPWDSTPLPEQPPAGDQLAQWLLDRLRETTAAYDDYLRWLPARLPATALKSYLRFLSFIVEEHCDVPQPAPIEPPFRSCCVGPLEMGARGLQREPEDLRATVLVELRKTKSAT
jgi:hypothetical protein